MHVSKTFTYNDSVNKCLVTKFDSSRVFKLDIFGWVILVIAFPVALAIAADPIASLIDTAFIGHIGMFHVKYSKYF